MRKSQNLHLGPSNSNPERAVDPQGFDKERREGQPRGHCILAAFLRPPCGLLAASLPPMHIAELSSKVLFTSDNPRNEDPDTIIEQMCEGVDPVDFKKTMSIPQRKEAIKVAYQLSQPGDVVLIAGKGHENYQEVKGEKHPFDDYKIAQEIFSKKP